MGSLRWPRATRRSICSSAATLLFAPALLRAIFGLLLVLIMSGVAFAGASPAVGTDPLPPFQALGFRQVDLRYEQPVGGPNGGPVTILDLLFCPHDPVDTVPTALVVATMQAYWTPWFGATGAKRAARELEARAHGAAWLKLVSPEPPR